MTEKTLKKEVSTKSNDASKVMLCTCTHEFQDSIYGKGKRLFVRLGKPGKATGYKCTVCGTKN